MRLGELLPLLNRRHLVGEHPRRGRLLRLSEALLTGGSHSDTTLRRLGEALLRSHLLELLAGGSESLLR